LREEQSVVYYLVLSSIGAAFILATSWLGFHEAPAISTEERMILGGAFIAGAIFGTSFALRPGWTKTLLKRSVHGFKDERAGRSKRRIRGHHPDCEHFESHTFKRGDRLSCAGCFGLATGSTVAILLMIIYLGFPVELLPFTWYVLLLSGFLMVIGSFIEIVIPTRVALVHVVSNILLVVGFFFVVVASIQLTSNLFFGLLGIMISFLWLDTRIQLSTWRHSIICKECSEQCKVY
jgi:hypothetical protein